MELFPGSISSQVSWIPSEPTWWDWVLPCWALHEAAEREKKSHKKVVSRIKTSPGKEKRNSWSLRVAHKGRGDFSPLRIRRGSNFKSNVLILSHISVPSLSSVPLPAVTLREIRDPSGSEGTGNHSSHPVGGLSQALHEMSERSRKQLWNSRGSAVLLSSGSGALSAPLTLPRLFLLLSE